MSSEVDAHSFPSALAMVHRDPSSLQQTLFTVLQADIEGDERWYEKKTGRGSMHLRSCVPHS